MLTFLIVRMYDLYSVPGVLAIAACDRLGPSFLRNWLVCRECQQKQTCFFERISPGLCLDAPCQKLANLSNPEDLVDR